MRKVAVGPVEIGGGELVLVAGPCVIESREAVLRVGRRLAGIAAGLGLPLIFKASFDKANRTSLDAFRGPGIGAGLEILAELKERLGVPVTTDVHLPEQAARAAAVVDLLQVPAFLSRQTDLLVACAHTGRPVNLKKGQFLAPWDMGPALEKLQRSGASGVVLTERGSCFGYNNLVADMRSLPLMRALGVPVCFDATHAVQLPGGLGRGSGGQRELAPVLARAAVAAGVDAIFLEVHEDPDRALSDGSNSLPLDGLGGLLSTLAALHGVAGG